MSALIALPHSQLTIAHWIWGFSGVVVAGIEELSADSPAFKRRGQVSDELDDAYCKLKRPLFQLLCFFTHGDWDEQMTCRLAGASNR